MSERVARFTASRALVEEFNDLCGGFRPIQTASFQEALDVLLERKRAPELKDPAPSDAISVSRRLRDDQWLSLDERVKYQGDLTRLFRGALELAVERLRKKEASCPASATTPPPANGMARSTPSARTSCATCWPHKSAPTTDAACTANSGRPSARLT